MPTGDEQLAELNAELRPLMAAEQVLEGRHAQT
jgi:hypothetical protein